MADTWLRWYRGAVEDGKMRAVARNARVTVRDVIAVWALLLEEAADPDHRGVCTKNEDYIAAVLDFDDGVVEEILQAMESLRMVSVGHGAITICHWKERQFETDRADPTNAERQRRHRAKKQAGPDRDVTLDRNGSVTAETRPDTDTDTEIYPPPVSPPLPPDRPAKRRGSRLPPDWQPGMAGRAFAAEAGFSTTEIEDVAGQFRDHWAAASGAGACKLDWAAAWRNWVRREAQYRARRQGSPRGPREPVSRAAAYMQAAAGFRGEDPVPGEWDADHDGLQGPPH